MFANTKSRGGSEYFRKKKAFTVQKAGKIDVNQRYLTEEDYNIPPLTET